MAIQSSDHLFLRMYENLESKGFFASRTEDTTFEIRLRSLLKEHKNEVHKKDMEQRMMMCTVARMFCLLPVQNHELNLLKNSFLSQELISLEFYTHLVKKLTEHMPSDFNYLCATQTSSTHSESPTSAFYFEPREHSAFSGHVPSEFCYQSANLSPHMQSELSLTSKHFEPRDISLGKRNIVVTFSNKKLDFGISDDLSYNVECNSLQGKSSFIFSALRSGCNIRLSLRCQMKENFEEIVHNTSLRLTFVSSPKNKTRGNKIESDISVICLDQLHVIKKFQGQGYGTKLIAIIIAWLSFDFPYIRRLVVISPSSIGKPFYLSLGATKENSSHNLVFNI